MQDIRRNDDSPADDVNRGGIGLVSLRLDAAYCTVLGIAVACCAPFVSTGLGLPPSLVVVAGIAVVAWAALILVLVRSCSLRTALRIVMLVNIVAATAVAATSVLATAIGVVLLVLAVAVDVGLFAGSQSFALSRLRRGA